MSGGRPRRPLPGDAFLERADSTLLSRVDGAFLAAAAAAGPHLACAPGCSECCIGPFPITALDAWRLRRGLARLESEDPSRAREVRARARAAVEDLRRGFPGDPDRGALHEETGAWDLFFQRHGSQPCPALDPESGRCDLYGARPVSCRTYGPPARFGRERADPCPLCFAGASGHEIERCRMAPDPEGLEERILRLIACESGKTVETLIAFALSGESP